MKKSELKQIIREMILRESIQAIEKTKEIIIVGELAESAEELFDKMGYRFMPSFSPKAGGTTTFRFKQDSEFKNAVGLLQKKLGVRDLSFENLKEDMKLDVDDFTATLMKDNVTLWIVPKSGKRINEKEIISKLKPLGIKNVDHAEMDSIKVVFKSPANFWKIRQAIWGK